MMTLRFRLPSFQSYFTQACVTAKAHQCGFLVILDQAGATTLICLHGSGIEKL